MIWERIFWGLMYACGACVGAVAVNAKEIFIEEEPKPEPEVNEEPPLSPEAGAQKVLDRILARATATVKSMDPHAAHLGALAEFFRKITREDKEEFKQAYEYLKYTLAVPPISKLEVTMISEVGNRLTFLLMLRNTLEDSPLIADFLLGGVDDFIGAVENAAGHLGPIGQQMCTAKARVLVNLLIKGVHPYQAKVG